MSKAAVSRTIKFSAKAGTYTATIMSPSGDLYQEWEGTSAEHNITPNFGLTKPKLYFICMSSRVSEGIVSADNMSIKYYFNGNLINFSGDTSTGTYAGYFKKLSGADSDQGYMGLQILQNLADLSGLSNVVIKMEASVVYNTQSDVLQAEYTIPVQKKTGSSYRVTISAGDGKAFVIREKGGSCVLKAMAYQSGTLLTKDLTYKWERMTATGWEEIAGQTGQTITVSGNDIDTYGEYRVTVFREGAEIGKDIQGVMDASDPYEIDANPSPQDETIREEYVDDKIVYTPRVVTRGTTTTAIPDAKFYFVVKDAVGNYLNTDRTTAQTSFTVTHAMAVQAGSDFTITITSED